MSCSVQWWISSGSSENRFRISCLAFSVFRLLRNQQTYVVSSIWRVIVISDTGLSASQAMPFPHGDLSINQDLIGIVENPVQDRLGNGAALIRIWMEPFIPVPARTVCRRSWLPYCTGPQLLPADYRIPEASGTGSAIRPESADHISGTF